MVYYVSLLLLIVSEHQLSHAINASHTTPTTHVNLDLMLLKLIGWRHYLYLSGLRTYSEPRPMLLVLNHAVSPGNQYMNNNNINMAGCQSSPGTLQ